MYSHSLKRRTLSDLLGDSLRVQIALVASYAVLIGIFSQLSIPLPFTPVPLTGQTFAVLLGAAALGHRRAIAGTLLYLVAGLAGLPWFAGGVGGLKVALSPSFGYLIGFIAAALVVGALAEGRMDRTPLRTLATMVLGNIAIYAFGITGLMLAIHVSLASAITLGVLPFLLGDLVKMLIAGGLLPGAWFAVRRAEGER